MMDGEGGGEERSYALISEGLQEHMTIEISTHMTEGDFLVVSQKRTGTVDRIRRTE